MTTYKHTFDLTHILDARGGVKRSKQLSFSALTSRVRSKHFFLKVVMLPTRLVMHISWSFIPWIGCVGRSRGHDTLQYDMTLFFMC